MDLLVESALTHGQAGAKTDIFAVGVWGGLFQTAAGRVRTIEAPLTYLEGFLS